MILYPTAKINIGLYVCNKRRDGYHDIETLFFPLKLCDILEFIPDNTGTMSYDQLMITGHRIPGTPADNLIVKACEKLRRISNLPFFKIHLHKTIPLGAGLGGGSSDGAAMLNGIQKYARPLPSASIIQDLALSIGSDCPFFLKPTCSFAYGRGEELKQADINIRNYWISIFYPGIHVSTSMAYQKVKIEQASFPIEDSLSQPVESWRKIVFNAFEPEVFKLYPEIEALKNSLYKAGAVYASMSGSGSSVFGIFRNKMSWMGSLAKTHIWTEQI